MSAKPASTAAPAAARAPGRLRAPGLAQRARHWQQGARSRARAAGRGAAVADAHSGLLCCGPVHSSCCASRGLLGVLNSHTVWLYSSAHQKRLRRSLLYALPLALPLLLPLALPRPPAPARSTPPASRARTASPARQRQLRQLRQAARRGLQAGPPAPAPSHSYASKPPGSSSASLRCSTCTLRSMLMIGTSSSYPLPRRPERAQRKRHGSAAAQLSADGAACRPMHQRQRPAAPCWRRARRHAGAAHSRQGARAPRRHARCRSPGGNERRACAPQPAHPTRQIGWWRAGCAA